MKFIFVSGFIDGPTCVDTLLFKSLNLKNKVYGVDYILLGYISGGATGMAAFASDINNIFKNDYYASQ
jgi:hypothetical protein